MTHAALAEGLLFSAPMPKRGRKTDGMSDDQLSPSVLTSTVPAGSIGAYFVALMSAKSAIHTVPVRFPTLKATMFPAAIPFARNSYR